MEQQIGAAFFQGACSPPPLKTGGDTLLGYVEEAIDWEKSIAKDQYTNTQPS